jgi:glutathione S-transferase
MSNVTLHQWEISPFCQKVAKALRYKGIAFNTVDYNGILGSKVAGLSKVGKVPVLDIDGQRIQDSTKIARYLDLAYPNTPRLYPADALERAQVELWEDWSDELLYFYEVYLRVNDPEALEAAVALSTAGRPAYERALIKPLLKGMLKLQIAMQGTGRMAAEDVHSEFLHHLNRIELVLGQTGYLVGSSPTIADFAVGAQLGEVVRTSALMRPEIQRRPNIHAWLAKL